MSGGPVGGPAERPTSSRDRGLTEDPRDAELAATLEGTWRLVSWESVGGDGSVEDPLGESPEGVLVYTAEGTVITTIGRRDRPPIPGGDMLTGPAEERLAAMGTFIAFSGTYRTEGGDVVHAVGMSLFPNWVGTEQRRHASFSVDGGRLTLSTDPMPVRGQLGRHRLTWERAA